MEIIPAILPKNYEDLKQKLSVVRGLVDVVQIDICDGIFVPSITWPFYGKGSKGTVLFQKNQREQIEFEEDGEEITISNEEKETTLFSQDIDEHFRKILNEEEGMPFWQDMEFELDLMTEDAVENFDIYAKLGPKRMIFHLNENTDISDFRDFVEGIDMYIREFIDIGIAINPEEKLEKFMPIVSVVDFVQVMGIKQIGFQGEPFDDRAIEMIKKIKNKYKDIIVSVDGGVNLETGKLLKDAGADRLVSGSAIFNSFDIINTLEEFENL